MERGVAKEDGSGLGCFWTFNNWNSHTVLVFCRRPRIESSPARACGSLFSATCERRKKESCLLRIELPVDLCDKTTHTHAAAACPAPPLLPLRTQPPQIRTSKTHDATVLRHSAPTHGLLLHECAVRRGVSASCAWLGHPGGKFSRRRKMRATLLAGRDVWDCGREDVSRRVVRSLTPGSMSGQGVRGGPDDIGEWRHKSIRAHTTRWIVSPTRWPDVCVWAGWCLAWEWCVAVAAAAGVRA